MLLFVCAVLFVVWFSLRTWHMVKICRSLKEIMYPCIPLPIIGQVYRIFMRTDYMNVFNLITEEATNNKHGVCAVWFGSKLCVFVADAEVALGVCNLPTCLDKGELYKFLKAAVGQGSLFAPAKYWRRRRKILMPGFSAIRLNSLFLQVFIPHAENIVERLQAMADKEHFNIRQYIDKYNISVVYETVLGKTLEQGEESGQQFLNSFDASVKILAERLMKPWLHIDILYEHLPIYKTLMHHVHILWDLIVKRIGEVRADIKCSGADAAKGSKFQPFLRTLIDNSGGGSGYTDLELREEVFVLLIAAIDTSAIGMSFVCLLLARYPKVQEKLHKELDDIFKGSSRPLTIEDLPRLQYLEAVIKEALRLYPPAPLISRRNVEPVHLASGVTLPKNTDIIFSTNGINRNPRYWGADAAEFKPERWLTGEKHHPAAFMTFSYGVRNCPGYKYSLMSIKAVLSTMLRRYRIVPEKDRGLEVYFNIMIQPVDGYHIRIEER